MKRYFTTSLIIHATLFVLALQTSMPKAHEQVEVSVVETGSGQDEQNNNKQKGSASEIINLNVGSEDKRELKDFYWGVGVNCEYPVLYDIPEMRGRAVMVYKITSVASGYSGESAGLQAGDVIYKINGLPVMEGADNDLRGEGPKKLVLTILRNGGKVIKTVERCKVYY